MPKGNHPQWLQDRSLFTMGHKATISFGITIAHHSVPLAIALGNLWDAQDQAKGHFYRDDNGDNQAKDAVQVRVLYGNGNSLIATSKFSVFHRWKALLSLDNLQLDPALFEQAAQLWQQHPAPLLAAIPNWVQMFCDRRDIFQHNTAAKEQFQANLQSFFEHLWQTTDADRSYSTPEAQALHDGRQRDQEIQNWLKLSAFMLRKRNIQIPYREGT